MCVFVINGGAGVAYKDASNIIYFILLYIHKKIAVSDFVGILIYSRRSLGFPDNPDGDDNSKRSLNNKLFSHNLDKISLGKLQQ